MRRAILIGLVLAASLHARADEGNEVPYPEGFRSWFHVKSQIATDKHARFAQIGGIHHIYANAAGVKGYQSGTFPNGAVLVLDVLALEDTEEGSQKEGVRRWIGVMQKDSEKYKDTGGWGFDHFNGDSKTDRNVAVNGPIERCVTCHKKRTDSDLVFSKLRP